MLRPIEEEMEVRLSPWDQTNPHEKVVSWTDRGWKFFVEHGFPDEARSFMNDYSSLMFLDFINRAHFVNSSVIKKRWQNLSKSCSILIKNIELISKIESNGEVDLEKIIKNRKLIEEMRDYANAMKSIERPRANRDPIYDYAKRLSFCASECGLQLTRGSKWTYFLDKIYRMHAKYLSQHLVEMEKIDAAIAEDQANLLKHVHSETILKKLGLKNDA